MKNLLILTVGTGTAGKHSDLAQGLRNTVEKIAPRQFWLAPSSSEDSKVIAELVAEGQPAFAGYLGPIEQPDDLSCCRLTIREAIRYVQRFLQKDEKLMVNPTSGTKQMSAGATIAALDEECGDIVFTVGERADGVVKTGTEMIVEFDAAEFFRERDCKMAQNFFEAGDFYAAERLLVRHKENCRKEYAVSAICLYWQRFDYAKAASAAATYDQKLKDHLSLCSHLDYPDEKILADILAWSFFALRHNEPETGARLAYKALEYAARWFLYKDYHIMSDENGYYRADACDQLELSLELKKKLKNLANPNLILGLKVMVQILAEQKHTFGKAVDWKLLELAAIRNENTHGIRPVDQREAQSFYDRVLNAVRSVLSDFQPTSLPEKGIL
jgi:hypothetical protein